MITRRASLAGSLVVGCVAAAVGFWAGNAVDHTQAGEGTKGDTSSAKSYKSSKGSDSYLRQTPAAVAIGREKCDYGLGDCASDKLKPYPQAKCGDPTPLDLYRYAGKAGSSFSSPTLPMSWDEWVKHCQETKPKIMADVRAYMAKMYDFNGKALPGVKMSAGKAIMAGPVARLPKDFSSWEDLAKLSPEGLKVTSSFQVMESLAWTPPSIAGTRLYLRDRKSIAAIELK